MTRITPNPVINTQQSNELPPQQTTNTVGANVPPHIFNNAVQNFHASVVSEELDNQVNQIDVMLTTGIAETVAHLEALEDVRDQLIDQLSPEEAEEYARLDQEYLAPFRARTSLIVAQTTAKMDALLVNTQRRGGS